MSSSKFIWLILTHQPADMVAHMVAGWEKLVSGEIVVLYGGPRAEFERVQHTTKFFVEDSRLVTKDHPRERQSYDGVFERALDAVSLSSADFVYFTEFDQIPLREDIANHLESCMESRRLDFMANYLQRIDGTNHPHWLNHHHDRGLEVFLRDVSRRRKKEVVLSAYGFGQCWRRDAFVKVASVRQTVEAYLELWIPSLAFHLGFKVGCNQEGQQWNTPAGVVNEAELDSLVEKPYFVHPLKNYWSE